MKRLATIIGVVLGTLFLLVLFGVTYAIVYADVSVASINTLKTGRTVTTQSNEWAGISTQDSFDTSTIQTANHVVIVAPTKLIIDGHPFATIDASVKTVTINVCKGDVSFVADGKPVAPLRR